MTDVLAWVGFGTFLWAVAAVVRGRLRRPKIHGPESDCIACNPQKAYKGEPK